jgi:phospholipase A1/A2
MNRLVAVAFLVSLSMSWAHADAVLSTHQSRAAAGAEVELELTITNADAAPVTIDVPSPLHVRLETKDALTTLEFVPERSGTLPVGPGAFVRMKLKGTMPEAVSGTVTLVLTGIESNGVLMQVDPAPPPEVVNLPGQVQTASKPNTATDKPIVFDKPPPLSVSPYEPLYVVVGGDGGLNAKFQISFRYGLFDGNGPLARRLPWIDDIYLGYSQTSLWDLGELSKPFKDTSYRPRLFYADYDLGRLLDGRVRLGVESGFGHESNGKEGEESRSFNMLYVRPTLTFGDPDGFRAYVAPLVHNYIADGENPDLKDYRGYVDWLLGVGSKGGWDFSALLRKGQRSSFGSAELSVTYPLAKLSGGDLTGWLTLQYFGGYGESLLDYQRKLDSQLRLGIVLAQ